MKIPQDQSEYLSKQFLSFNIENSGSARSLKNQRSQFSSENITQKIVSESEAKSGTSKSCWFNILILIFIIVVLGTELSYRSDELQQEPEPDNETQFTAQTYNQQDQQISITKAERKEPPDQNKKYQEEKQKYQKQKKKEQEERRKRQQYQAYERECTRLTKDQQKNFFFLYLDKEEMVKQQAEKFHSLNERYCHFHILYEVDFEYIVDIWNYREEAMTEKRQFINKTNLKKQDKKMLFIFLQQYFWGGLYVHTSLGLKFGDYLSDRFISRARIGKQVMFAEGDHENQKGFLIPKRNSRAIKVDQNFSERLEKLIRKIIAQEDWMDVCQNYQCAIVKKAIK